MCTVVKKKKKVNIEISNFLSKVSKGTVGQRGDGCFL